jgi:hypothetical protein
MKLVFALVPALLFATVASGQEVAEESAKDLWCGIAFGLIAATLPADADDQQKALAQQYADGSAMLVERSKPAHLAGGYTEETFTAHVETLTADVGAQIQTQEAGASAAYSFEECFALIQS